MNDHHPEHHDETSPRHKRREAFFEWGVIAILGTLVFVAATATVLMLNIFPKGLP